MFIVADSVGLWRTEESENTYSDKWMKPQWYESADVHMCSLTAQYLKLIELAFCLSLKLE